MWQIICQSKLQSETALSTMEAEIVALAHNCHKLFPIMDGVSIMGKVISTTITAYSYPSTHQLPNQPCIASAKPPTNSTHPPCLFHLPSSQPIEHPTQRPQSHLVCLVISIYPSFSNILLHHVSKTTTYLDKPALHL